MNELWKYDGIGQADLLKRGEISPRELLEATIRRIERIEPRIHALTATRFEQALQSVDDQVPEGRLGGVPFLVKDLISYPGMPLTFGSRLFRMNQTDEVSPFTTRIQEANLRMLGKTTTSEFGLLGSTESLLSGVSRNPWNAARSATGSSGGSAAAVAVGMVPLAHANDGGGSIRIPASACGLFGFKPSNGRIVPTSFYTNDFSDLVVDHVVTRSVRDSAAFLDLFERKEKGYPPVGFIEGPVHHSSDHSVTHSSSSVSRPLRIGYYNRTLLGADVPAEIQDILMKTVRLCEELGHDVRPIAPPAVDGRALSDAFFTAAGAAMDGVARFMEGIVGPIGVESMLEPFTLSLIEWYRSLSIEARNLPAELFQRTSLLMQRYAPECDIFLSPVTGIPTPEIGFLAPTLGREELIRRTEVFAGFTPVHNIAGMPAMSVPLFQLPDGMPCGSHFAARRGEEALLLGLAYQLEQAAPWHGRLIANMERM